MTLILTQSDVCHLLPMDACIDLMERALKTLADGGGVNPLRRGIFTPDRSGLLGMMPGYLSDPPALGIKVVTVFPSNHGTELDAHQGMVILFELERGTPACIMNASAITAIRTAAVTGVATRALARANARSLAMIGTGVQAKAHVEAIAAVRPIEQLRVFSRAWENREAFVAHVRERFSFDVEAVDSAQAAVRDADIICTTTSSREPVLLGAWIPAGAHVNTVGSSVRTARELDADGVAKSRLFVDRMESALNESGEILTAIAEGAITEDHIVGELGDVLSRRVPGRRATDETTLFNSLGLAVEDLAAAHYVFEHARSSGVGVEVSLEGLA